MYYAMRIIKFTAFKIKWKKNEKLSLALELQ